MYMYMCEHIVDVEIFLQSVSTLFIEKESLD